MGLTDDLKEHAKLSGIDLVGVTSAKPFLMGEKQRRVDPSVFLRNAESIVVTGLYVYLPESTEPSLPGHPRGRYGPWRRASVRVRNYCGKLVKKYLERHGFKAVFTNYIPYKMAAIRSGMAYYGKNCLIHTDEFGSFLKLAAVITDAELECIDIPIQTSDCGDCQKCIDACPTQALEQPYYLIRERCIAHWHWGAPIPRGLREKMGDLIFGCGFCQEVCPKNQGLVPRKELPVKLESKSDRPELISLLLADENEFKRIVPEDSFMNWVGLDTIKRNVAIALGNRGDPAAVPALLKALGEGSPRVRVASVWALGKLGGAEVRETLEKALAQEMDQEVREEIKQALVGGSKGHG